MPADVLTGQEARGCRVLLVRRKVRTIDHHLTPRKKVSR